MNKWEYWQTDFIIGKSRLSRIISMYHIIFSMVKLSYAWPFSSSCTGFSRFSHILEGCNYWTNRNIDKRIPSLEREDWEEYLPYIRSYSPWFIFCVDNHFLPCILVFQGLYKLWRAVTIEQIGILINGFHHWKEKTE